MEAYSVFAQVYDYLMQEVDYDIWVDFLENIFTQEEIKPKNILDLACGTGNVTNRLARRNYKITGIDISPEMLSIAQSKALEQGLKVKYLNQDMINFEIKQKFDCIISMCDGINYILEDEDLEKVFKRVYFTLEDNGLFIFDISSFYKISLILGNNVYAENYDDAAYIWQNYFDENTNICQLDLILFIRKSNMFERFQETHYQRAYTIEEISNLLRKTNFKILSINDNFSFNKANETSERINFICKK